MFPKINQKQSFPALEEEILQFWKEENIFEESLKQTENNEEFVFFDGPPFATGTPHYGHILAGVIKDVIPRYQTMKGKYVSRKFGWDCHGLPIENIVEKKLNISGKDDIESHGIHEFNETCRENVLTYVDDWKKTVRRMGRWVDMENDYKTMDTDFMESVWWVFKKIYDKWAIYESHRVVPYCPRCMTPLSNFEVNQGYKDVSDKTITVKFQIKDGKFKDVFVLAWTTTPWTLPGNLGLAVGNDLEYVCILDKQTEEKYILAKDLLKKYYKKEEDYTVEEIFLGKEIIDQEYIPLFDFYEKFLENISQDEKKKYAWEKTFKIVSGHHVTTESGTGIVHIAPAFGEDDSIIGKEKKLGLFSHIDEKWEVIDLNEAWNGKSVWELNNAIIESLKIEKKSIKIESYTHSYPHCWRCDSKLIYKAISAWYVKVEEIRDQMIKNNNTVSWVPETIKHGRFGKWLEGARDWNISRNRYWGSALPVWKTEDGKKEICIGSRQELYEANKDFWDITKVIFVRHGRTDYNEKGLMDYKNNAQLTEAGKKQAWKIAEILSENEIHAIYSSPLDRCIDTISPLAQSKNLEVLKIDDLVEITSPDLQDKEFSCKNYTWENGYGGGETIKQAYERVEKAFHKIIEENKGKTVVICSHGDPTFLMRKSLYENIDYDTQKYTCGKYLENNPEKNDISAMYGMEYVYTKTNKALDIHKHFVDKIFIKNPEGRKAKKVLGIHGFKRTNDVIDFFEWTKKNLSKDWISVDAPVFELWANISYKNWEKKLDSLNVWEYDTILCHSLGCRVAMEYIIEKKINIPRLILVAPGLKSTTEEVNNFYSESKNDFSEIKEFVEELIIISSDDDRSERVEWVKKIVEITWGYFIQTQGFGHFNVLENTLIEWVVKNGVPMQRIPEVLDCWFESGAMPYASKHYPFLEEDFTFPGDFIAEGIDQTRGWFYTLMILSTHLFDESPFKNVIVNGMVLAEDGNKMSKSKQNYPDPHSILDNYGADAMRFYLMSSPVVEAQDFRFIESGVAEVVKKIILPFWNAYGFFTLYANIDKFTPSGEKNTTIHELDRWILSKLELLISSVTKGLDSYELMKSVQAFSKFFDELNNWYIRRNRKRFWKSENDSDKFDGYETLYEVLSTVSVLLAPVCPFVSEKIFKNLTGKKSVHLEMWPETQDHRIDIDLMKKYEQLGNLINLGLSFRSENTIRVRQPLASIKIVESLDNESIEILKEELNIKDVEIISDIGLFVEKKYAPDAKKIAMSDRKKYMKEILTLAKSGQGEIINGNLELLLENGERIILDSDEFSVRFDPKKDINESVTSGYGTVMIVDDTLTEELILEGYARDIIRTIQDMRKEAEYDVSDRIKIHISGDKSGEILENFSEMITSETLSQITEKSCNNLSKEIHIDTYSFIISIEK